jgi:hypothetical protein
VRSAASRRYAPVRSLSPVLDGPAASARERIAMARTHGIALVESEVGPDCRDSVGGYAWRDPRRSWPLCRLCESRLVLFLQLETRAAFELPFAVGSQLAVYMCTIHNEIPHLLPAPQLPPNYWSLGSGHYALFLTQPGMSEASREEEPHLAACALRFQPDVDRVRVLGGALVGAEGFRLGGTPSWAQEPEPHTCCCGAQMAFVGQVPADFGFRRRTDAPEQPDSFSADHYCLFLGNEVYLFGCARQCHPQAVWPIVQNS